MAAELGADSLFYLPLEAVARCIGLPEDRLCRACLTGEYPTPTGERLVSAGPAQSGIGKTATAGPTNRRHSKRRAKCRNRLARRSVAGHVERLD